MRVRYSAAPRIARSAPGVRRLDCAWVLAREVHYREIEIVIAERPEQPVIAGDTTWPTGIRFAQVGATVRFVLHV
jgi:hypothetical protein